MQLIEPFIRAYRSILTNPMMLIFTVLSVFQLVNGWQELLKVRPRWNQWLEEPLKPWKRTVGDVFAYYAAVPISVMIHELFHAIAVWILGGHIIEFGFFFFWGYVLPDRVFPHEWQEWSISFAGTVGSLLFGLTVWLLGRNHRSSSVRFAVKRTVRFQIIFSLIYYPIFTAALSFGDWKTIYDFNATPTLSGITAFFHVIALLAYWYGEKNDWFTMPAFQSQQQATQFQDLQQGADTLDNQLQLMRQYIRMGSTKKADELGRTLLKQYPNEADVHYIMTFVHWDRIQTEIPRKSVDFARTALQLGVNTQQKRWMLEHASAQYEAELGRDAIALEQFTTLINQTQYDAKTLHPILFHRALIYIRQGQDNLAKADLQRAIQTVGIDAPIAKYYHNYIQQIALR